MTIRPRPKPAVADLKQERAVRTRGLILDAAARAFADKGYPATTILDVAELMGATKGAVYFHFANKGALAAAVTEEFYVRLRASAQQVTDQALPPLATLAELLVRTGVLFRDDEVIRAGARLQIEQSLIETDLPAPFVGYTETVTGLLRAAHAEGALPGGHDPEAVGRVLVSAFFGAQHMSWVMNDRADIAERVREILSVVLPGAADAEAGADAADLAEAAGVADAGGARGPGAK
ncbi:ScbR family autoregulator-binding transcription factor [Streptomyces sp. NBC_00083]|uniref:ScbR family autoregulator-binding transcription factor n=1 Tax=Streptomyces sp. NBC_00083 TaxID=2975647 RepID=UPI00225C06C9|nr:ScbR family autoregulator-binding transcription factor [Streptomyces sp. NBC_00083]MCX5388091.1 ScbR family autoregulator-binding transcription factor [Streptomyces sp. NBC_00083]